MSSSAFENGNRIGVIRNPDGITHDDMKHIVNPHGSRHAYIVTSATGDGSLMVQSHQDLMVTGTSEGRCRLKVEEDGAKRIKIPLSLFKRIFAEP